MILMPESTSLVIVSLKTVKPWSYLTYLCVYAYIYINIHTHKHKHTFTYTSLIAGRYSSCSSRVQGGRNLQHGLFNREGLGSKETELEPEGGIIFKAHPHDLLLLGHSLKDSTTSQNSITS